MKATTPTLTVSKRTNVVVHRIALLFTIIAAIFGFLAMAGIGQVSPSYSGLVPTLTITILWLFYCLWQFSQSTEKVQPRQVSLNRLAVFHLFASLYAVGVVDFTSPLLYLWSLLVVASYIYFGLLGSLLSLMTLYGALIVNLMLSPELVNQSLDMIISALIVTCIGLVTVYVVRSTQTDQEEIDSSQAQIALQQDRTLTLINNLADAVISTDEFGTITLYNAAVLNLLDTNDNIIGQNIDRVIQIKTTDNQRIAAWDMLRQASTVTIRDDITTKVGNEKIRLEMTFTPIRGNYSAADDTARSGGFVLILRDITASKSLEEERDEFISVVSHELRTPITIAEGTLSNLAVMMERSSNTNDRLKSAVSMAHDQMVFLARMVNDLSTLSRAERGLADEAEEIDVDSMIHDLFNEHQSEAEQKNLAFDLNISGKAGPVMASRLYLKELLQNFVTNAIKYTREGGVTVKVRKVKDVITIAVTDTGIGMSKSDQKRIFDKFYRAEDYRTRETNGTGLGLYVANKLARKLNTEIKITSRLNHGSTFSIDVPAYKKPADEPKD